ncbi:hypothetical protein KAW11_04405 [Candidatus Bathyarchaeota archaeon]|nr:hypothetical protein [Candidatus Bathyarchaeota archaeon]
MKEEVRLGRPSIAFGIVIIGLTVYCMINWPGGWTENLHDILLVLAAFSTGINAIATGAPSTCTPCDTKQENMNHREKWV